MQRLKLYLAGPSAEHERVAAAAAMLDRSGLTSIVDRWWEDAAEWTGRDREWSVHESRRIAREHLRALRTSEVVWLLFPAKFSFGAIAELGAVLAERKPLIVTGPRARDTVYTSLADFIADDDRAGAVEVFRLSRASHPLALVP